MITCRKTEDNRRARGDRTVPSVDPRRVHKSDVFYYHQSAFVHEALLRLARTTYYEALNSIETILLSRAARRDRRARDRRRVARTGR